MLAPTSWKCRGPKMRSELCCSLLLKENVRPVYRVFLVQSILPRPDSFFVHSHLFYFNIYLHSPRTRGLMDYIDRYAVDGFHPSEKGHTVIAGLIKKLVERIGVPAQPRMGKLLFTDSCHSWIQGGGQSIMVPTSNLLRSQIRKSSP